MLPWLLAALNLAAVVLMVPALGQHLFDVFDERPQPAWDRWLNPIEDALLRWIGDAGRSAESAGGYLVPLLVSNALFALPALALLLFQPGWLNPLGFGGLRWDLALHTTISFLTNTDQQHLVPEQALGNLAQLGALQFLMFVSAATGLAVGFAVIRGFSGRPIGNVHRDLLRSLTRVLIPGALLLALFLVVSGVPMTLPPPMGSTRSATRPMRSVMKSSSTTLSVCWGGTYGSWPGVNAWPHPPPPSSMQRYATGRL